MIFENGEIPPDRIIPAHQTPDGVERKLFSFATPEPVLKAYSADFVIPDVPKSEWREFEYQTSWKTVENQGQYGACVGHGGDSVLQWARWLAGMGVRRLSPWYLYSLLCNGRDVGASPYAAMDWLKSQGTCSFDLVPWGTISPRLLTNAAHTDAKRFRVQRGPRLTSFDQLMSATQLGFPICGTVHADAGFMKFDKNGVAQNRPGSHNHCIVKGLGAKRLPNGEWAIKYENSWDVTYGLGGYGWGTRATFEGPDAEEFAVATAYYDPATYTPPVRLAA